MAIGTDAAKQPQMENRVGMTCRAILRRASIYAVLMAVGAGHRIMRSGEREGCQRVIEGSLFPIYGGVAGGAVVAILSVMLVNFGVAGVAILRGTLIDAILMAIFAGDIDMLAFQREIAQIMVEGSLFPICGDVAEGAVGAVLPVMLIIFGMAGVAILWGACVDIILVTGFAGHIAMFAL